ncbi:MAG TPA: hypothetical protein VJY84_01220 [Candidatus Saccharimonadales bacterium]|nr:hypothetical protein [Candidatus Saccharimonadales bacterium]
MSKHDMPSMEIDAWDHVYSLDPEDRDEAFELVMANLGHGYTNVGQLDIPEGVHLVSPMAVDQVGVAIATIIELDAKGAYSGKDF